jgi:xanthine/uracil permease
MVTLAGLRIVASSGWTRRNELILAITLSLGLGVSMVPEWVGNLDQSTEHVVATVFLSSVKVVLESGLVVGAITATLMNLMLPRER